jgi:hypothetical protein
LKTNLRFTLAIAVCAAAVLVALTASVAQHWDDVRTADAQEVQTTVSLLPNNFNLNVGDTFTVDAVVEAWASPPAGEEWEAYQVSVVYNTAIIGTVSPIWENLVTTFPNGPDCVSLIQPGKNLVSCGDDGLPPQTHTMEVPQPLVRMHFQCIGDGTSTLLNEPGALGTFIIDDQGEEVQEVLNSATVTCGTGVDPTPTNTPTPTATLPPVPTATPFPTNTPAPPAPTATPTRTPLPDEVEITPTPRDPVVGLTPGVPVDPDATATPVDDGLAPIGVRPPGTGNPPPGSGLPVSPALLLALGGALIAGGILAGRRHLPWLPANEREQG